MFVPVKLQLHPSSGAGSSKVWNHRPSTSWPARKACLFWNAAEKLCLLLPKVWGQKQCVLYSLKYSISFFTCVLLNEASSPCELSSQVWYVCDLWQVQSFSVLKCFCLDIYYILERLKLSCVLQEKKELLERSQKKHSYVWKKYIFEFVL